MKRATIGRSDFFRHLKPFLQNEGCVRGNPFTAFLLYHEGKTSCHNDLECMLAHLKSNQIHFKRAIILWVLFCPPKRAEIEDPIRQLMGTPGTCQESLAQLQQGI